MDTKRPVRYSSTQALRFIFEPADAYNEAAKRVSHITMSPPDSGSLERRLHDNPQEVLDELEQVNSDIKLMNEERARRLARLNRAIIITVILLLVLIGVKLIK